MNNKNTKQATNNEEMAKPSLTEMAAPDASMEAREVDANERYPVYAVEDDVKIGQTVAGIYLGTRVIPAKGERRRSAIIEFRNTKGQKFGLWATGVSENYFRRVPTNSYAEVTYAGKAKNAFKPGQSPAHDYTFKLGKGVELLPMGSDEEADMPLNAARGTDAGASAHQ